MISEPSKGFVLSVLLVVALFLGLRSLSADTVFLKDGTSINDCKVLNDKGSLISLRTKAGRMMVPRSKVQRILRQKNVFDRYEEQRAKLPENSAQARYKLAQWCRKTDGLWEESTVLLEEALEIQNDHAGVRRLLGHLKIAGEWIVPDPLVIELQISHGGEVLRQQLELFLESRQDIRLADEELARGAASGGPSGYCKLLSSVVVSRKSGTRFYGAKIGGPSMAASLNLRASGSWVGKAPLKVTVDGQAPAAGSGNKIEQAVQNAMFANGRPLHLFFDKLTQRRLKVLYKELKQRD